MGNQPALCGHDEGMGVSDDELWERSRAGDREAFAALFERHAGRIYNYCFRRIGSWATAEDMLSVVFLETWRRREKELPPEKVLPWLYGIATNVARNQRRAARRFASTLSRMPRSEPTPDFAAAADERLDDEQQARNAIALLRRTLSKDSQDVFVLCAVEGLSYEDAAVALGVPVGTVRSRLSRARARLGELELDVGHENSESTTLQEVGRR